MDIRNRMANVVKLRCNTCQDFFKMVIKPNWQQELYNKAKYEVETNSKYKNMYIAAYEKMRDIGIENYSIDDMDVTFMSEILYGCRNIVPTQDVTRKAMRQLKDDRNLTDHSGENEEPEELYLRGLLALCNLRNFVRAVDKAEITIDDAVRLEFRRTHICMIDEMKSILDDERIEIIQRKKKIDQDIARILEADDPLSKWVEISKMYMDRDWKLEKNPDGYHEFIVKASDAGIPQAHDGAASYFILIKKDYAEAERRLFMLYDSVEKLPAYEMKTILDSINTMLSRDGELTEGMKKLIENMKEQGFDVEQTEGGLFQWNKSI